MFCTNCGAANGDGSFCNSCGNQVTSPATTSKAPASNAKGFATPGLVMGIISFLVLPYVFGVLGIVFGVIAKSRGEQNAQRAITVSVIGLAAGIVLQILLLGLNEY